jgi:general secretion pathway protein D
MNVVSVKEVMSSKSARSTIIRAVILTSLLLSGEVPLFAQPSIEGDDGPTTMPGQENTGGISTEDPDPSDLKEITLKNADISTIIRIFSKRTKRNFILDEKVRGTVTVYLPGEIPKETEMKILDSILALKGFTTVPISANLWKVIPAKDARKSTVPMRGTDARTPTTGSVVTTLVSMTYVAANDVQPLINQMISPEGMVQVYPANNSLVIVDYDTNVERLVDLIKSLDIPAADREMTIIPVRHAVAADLAEKLTAVLNDSADSSGQGGNRSPNAVRLNGAPGQMPGMQGIPGNSSDGSGAGGGVQQRREPKLIADERTNSIIIVADLETTARIKALASELDSEVDRSGSKFYVYRCQHANATALAQVLSGSTSGQASGGTGQGQSSLGGGSLGGGGGTSVGRGGSSFGGGGNNGAFGGGAGGLGGGGLGQAGGQGRGGGSFGQGLGQQPASTSVQLDQNTSITSDPATNSLVIFASEGGYQKILTLLKELDIKRRQVLVEAVILEVSVDEATQKGTDWLSSTGGADGAGFAASNFGGAQGLTGLLADPSKLSGFSVAAASAGSLKLPGGGSIPTQTIILNAAQKNSKVNVLSSPTLLGTDNEEAQIVVGQNVPFLASTGTNQTNLNNTFNQINRQDVGITLRLTPQINSNDYVTLRVYTDVSSVVPSADTTLGPTTTVRSSQTTIVVKDSQMIAIGGLISDKNSDSTSGIPLLKDIPILGEAFGRNSEDRSRTNLLTFITPHIIHDQFDARDESILKRDELRSEIDRQKVEPSREDILGRDSLHKVAEISRNELPVPEPIVPSQSDIEQSRAALNMGTNQAASKHAGEAINLNQLEEEAPVEANVEAMITSQTTSALNASTRCIVIKVQAPAAVLSSLPFPVNNHGLALLQLDDPGSQSFFTKNKKYAYLIGDKKIPVEKIASFGSQEEARTVFNEDPLDPYSLSSYEISNLGSGPWLTSR